MSPEAPSQPPYQPPQPQPQPQPTYQQPQPMPTAQAPKESKALAIVGFIFAFVFAPVGLVISIIALAKRRPGKGLAIAGLIISIINILSLSFFALVAITALQNVQVRAKDAVTTSEAHAVQSSLESYAYSKASYDADYTVKYTYPTAAQLKDSNWVTTNLTSLDSTAAKDLTSSSSKLIYTPSPSGCDGTETSPCTNYELTYTTSEGQQKLTAAAPGATTNE